MKYLNKIPVKKLCGIFFMTAISLNVFAQTKGCPSTSEEQYFFHIAHTRTGANPLMDPVVEEIDFSFFDMLLLGGDMALATSKDDTTMMHVDSVFNLGNASTLWALGNHDYADLNRIANFTHRDAYFATHQNNITFLVLDTQDSLSNIIGDQLDLFRNVIDTIQESTHLILLHHKLIWMYGHPILQPMIRSVANGELGTCFYCINPNNFYTDIYPELVEVEKRGIEVICLAGDIGFRRSEFEYITEEGIQFLASGIEAGKSNNKGLLFKYNSNLGTLDWEYKLLSELLIPMDTTSAILYSVSVTPDSVLRGDDIRVIIEAEDKGSGLSEINMDIIGPYGEQLIQIDSTFGDLTQLGDGKYALDLTISESAATGTWNIPYVTIIDSSENMLCQQYQDSVLASFFVLSSTLSVPDEYRQVLIYPNPGTGRFYYSGVPDIQFIQVIDQTGRITDILNDHEANSIDLSNQPKGICFIRMITSDGKFFLKRIIIQ